MIIFGTPGLVRMRGLRAGFPGSTTCPYWCFEVKIQDVADSNCDLGGENEAGTLADGTTAGPDRNLIVHPRPIDQKRAGLGTFLQVS